MSKPAPDVQRIFDQALEIDSSQERARFLDQACGSDTAIRDEIASPSIPYFKRNEITAAITRLVGFYEGRLEPQKALEWRQKLPPSGAPLARPRF